MYRGRLWTMRQYAGFATAEESNKRYRYLLAQGVSGLSVAFDLPTQMGYDSDHPLAAGEVGRVGVAIDSIEDMAALFDGIPLDRVSTSMTINATAVILLSLYVAVAKQQGASLARLSGTIQNDILKEYVARGTYIYPPRASLRIVTDIFAFCERELPNWNTISISGIIREAGSTAVRKCFTFARSPTCSRRSTPGSTSTSSDSGCRSSSTRTTIFEEIAKYAPPRLWARIMRDRFHATNARAALRTAATAGARSPPNSRTTTSASRLQAMAAVLGGTQCALQRPRRALALPTGDRRAWRCAQRIIAAERRRQHRRSVAGSTRSKR